MMHVTDLNMTNEFEFKDVRYKVNKEAVDHFDSYSNDIANELAGFFEEMYPDESYWTEVSNREYNAEVTRRERGEKKLDNAPSKDEEESKEAASAQ